MRETNWQKKVGPTLLQRLQTAETTGVGDKTISALVAFKKRADRWLGKNHDVLFNSADLGVSNLALSSADIAGIAQEGDIAWIDADHVAARIPGSVSFTTEACPLNADVFRRYKTKSPLIELDGDGITVMVQDTGYSPHRDIQKLVEVRDFTTDGTVLDYYGHGTAIVSQMGAVGSYPGLIPQAHIAMARIFDRRGSCLLSSILRAHAWALEKEVDVVNMSYGSPLPNPIAGWALERLSRAGVCLVAAAGNSGPTGHVEFPGAFPSVIAVAALDKSGRVANFSSRGIPGRRPMKPDLAAEGVQIVMAHSPHGEMGTPVDADHIAASGTSFAAPIVAGLAAMVRQAKGDLSPLQMRQILQDAAQR